MMILGFRAVPRKHAAVKRTVTPGLLYSVLKSLGRCDCSAAVSGQYCGLETPMPASPCNLVTVSRHYVHLELA